MGIEIERKFLLKDDSWKDKRDGIYYHQGYLSTFVDRTVRVRLAGKSAFLTIKGKSDGISRTEFEYEIPFSDAQFMLQTFCKKTCIKKHRYKVKFGKHLWEIDEFHDENEGLLLAEIELSSEEEEFELPPWLGIEVSGDPKYYNSNLCKHPFTKW